MNTVAGSNKRIFLCVGVGIVQASQGKTKKTKKLGEALS
tara:strand:- start:348 stop:464 length:117 start_codon:yes stop_codon:yes gene_type:complete